MVQLAKLLAAISTPLDAEATLTPQNVPRRVRRLGDDGEQQRGDAAEAMNWRVEKEGQHCIGEVGHEGRQRYRHILPATDGLH